MDTNASGSNIRAEGSNGTDESTESHRGYGFGVAPVFLTSICTILGAIMFLRFGYAVAHVGLMGALLIILLGHLVTIPTALAISEIATNRRVEGGGEYFIISRSFGLTIGGSIGIAVFLSRAISVAFYMIAFAETFQPWAPQFAEWTGIPFDPRIISLPATLLLIFIVLFRGANIGVAALWGIAAILGLSLIAFFAGTEPNPKEVMNLTPFGHVPSPDPFSKVFAIIFPAFTGMIAGVGLSGDLANPKKSLPLGILSATFAGMLIYFAIMFKLYWSASPDMLAADPLIMARISIWGPIILIGLASATLSSAVGSILTAPRTIQALGTDRTLPWPRINEFLAAGIGKVNEPRNATVITGIIAIVMVAAGNLDSVARIISMFFMVTYGSVCMISFLEHFAANPSYRPSFRSRWYVSLLGAIMCLFMMFQMDPLYALLSIGVMALLYLSIQRSRQGHRGDLAVIFESAMTQAVRYMQVKLQRQLTVQKGSYWRPSIIMVNGRTFDRNAPLRLLSWLCHRYGFGTYLHYIPGYLNAQTHLEQGKILRQLVDLVGKKGSNTYVSTMISPSIRSALAQTLQVPGVSGIENNTIMFEFSIHDPPVVLKEILDGSVLSFATGMNVLVLRHTDHHFGDHRQIHVWFTWHDAQNVSLMILLSYILLGNPDWKDAQIRVFAVFPRDEVETQSQKLTSMISEGRIPIAKRNIRIIPTEEDTDVDRVVERLSGNADLVIFGFTEERLQKKQEALLQRFSSLHDVLLVSAQERVLIE